MILVVGGAGRGGGVFVEYLNQIGRTPRVLRRGHELPDELPGAIVFYQRDRRDEFAAAVQVTARIVYHYVERAFRGPIVMIGSTAIREDDGSSSEYRLAKQAMLSLVRSYAGRFKAKGVWVNMVSPGGFRDGPLTALDVAKVVGFFVSPESRFITGQEIVVRA